MAGLFYSTNTYLKFLIQRDYRDDIHYVWCSESFDNKSVAPSANPADIYRELKEAVVRSDRHSLKIGEQKAALTTRAIEWATSGKITKADSEDIVYLVSLDDFSNWRPLLYLIPRTPEIEKRAKLVPVHKRASHATEYIIEDVHRDEFDAIEF